MKRFALTVVLLALVGTGPAWAADPMEGTWQLVSRDLPDGGTLAPPAIVGMYDCHGGQRNFNVAWTTPDGAMISISMLSSYAFTDAGYTETPMFSSQNMEGELAANMAQPAKTVHVTAEGTAVTMQMPYEPVAITVDGDNMTAVANDGSFTDHWVRQK